MNDPPVTECLRIDATRYSSMYFLDLTLATPEENVALDEALLALAESSAEPLEILRLWESPEPVVVVGRASRVAEEVNLGYCQAERIPVLRRCSGGTSVVLGPGCLTYSVVLSYRLRPHLQQIDEVHRLVLGRIAEGLRGHSLPVSHEGISDLAIAGHKVSGNSLRCQRHSVLYHGTLLYDFQLGLIARCLQTAPRQPEYRAGRDHLDFVRNIPATADQLREGVRRAWPTNGMLADWPRAATQSLVASRYSQAEWNLRM